MIAELILSTTIHLSPCHTSTYDDSKLLHAIMMVESGGDPNAVGDNGKAIGPYQIHRVYWMDAVEFDPSIGGKYSDCKNKAYAEKIVRAYWKRYATERRIGRPVTDADRARIHNGGPNGFKKAATRPYWEKVKKRLKKVTNILSCRLTSSESMV